MKRICILLLQLLLLLLSFLQILSMFIASLFCIVEATYTTICCMIFTTITTFYYSMWAILTLCIADIAIMFKCFMLSSTQLTNWLTKTSSSWMSIFLTVLTLFLSYIFFAFFSNKPISYIINYVITLLFYLKIWILCLIFYLVQKLSFMIRLRSYDLIIDPWLLMI